MQTPPIERCQTAPLIQPLVGGNTASSSITVGEGRLAMALPLPEPQTDSIPIELMDLTNEVLVLIMQKIDDPTSILMLSTTCQRFRTLYRDKRVYKAWQRQKHLADYNLVHNLRHNLTYNLRVPTFCKHFFTALYEQREDYIPFDRTTIPYPDTAEWQQLLIAKPKSSDFVRRAYVIAWTLLLEPDVLDHHEQAAQLMQILIDLAWKIKNKNAENYVEKLFNKGLCWDVFSQLANIDLNRCLQLIAKYFPISRDSPAYKFIITQLPATLRNRLQLIKGLKSGEIFSVLFYTIENLPLSSNRQHKALRELLEMLLDEERIIDLNAHNCDNYNALAFAVENGNLAAVQCLLQHPKIDVNVIYSDYRILFGMALDIAIEKGNLPILQALLQHPAIDISSNREGMQYVGDYFTPLAHAVDQDNLSIVEALLQYPNIQVDISQLFTAIERGNLSIVEALLQHPQIDVNAEDMGSHALNLAVQLDNLSILQCLLQHPNIKVNPTALIQATEKGNLSFLKTLLQHPTSNVNARDGYGRSALHYVNNVSVLQYLLQFPQIDVKVRDNKGNNILHEAVRCGYLNIVQALLQYSEIDVNTTNNEGKSPLDIAIEKGNLPIVDTLLQHAQIDVNVSNDPDLSALYFAIKHHVLRLVHNLLSTTNIALDYRIAAFNYAIWIGKDGMVRVFLQAMDAQEKHRFINQALALALKNRQRDVARCLRKQYGAVGKYPEYY